MTQRYAKKLAWLWTASALVLVTAACAPVQRNRYDIASSGVPNSYVDEVLADQSDLSVFYRSLLTTGVANELNNNTEYTIFAPTNAAFSQINPRFYPCFYAVQCRAQVAAVLRNHIVPRNESIYRFSRWGGDIVTLGNRHIEVEEPYKGRYTVEGHRVLYQNENQAISSARGHKITLYHIDGVIASDQDMAAFRAVPLAQIPTNIMEKTVTTYHAPLGISYAQQPYVQNTPLVPGGYATNPVAYVDEYDDTSGGTMETTTVTRRTRTQ